MSDFHTSTPDNSHIDSEDQVLDPHYWPPPEPWPEMDGVIPARPLWVFGYGSLMWRPGFPFVRARRARIHGHASHAQEPGWFTTAPVPAMQKLLDKVGWEDSVDLWEINEAFAVVPMAAMEEIGIPREKVNVHGGACALGHPVGTSGTRIIVTLLNALETYDKTRGIAALCIGGGEGTAVAIERV